MLSTWRLCGSYSFPELGVHICAFKNGHVGGISSFVWMGVTVLMLLCQVSICSSWWNWDAPSGSWALSPVTKILGTLIDASKEKRFCITYVINRTFPILLIAPVVWLPSVYIKCCEGDFVVGFPLGLFNGLIVSSFRCWMATFCTWESCFSAPT